MLKTDRCCIYEIKESDLADVLILFTDDEVRTYLGGAYDKARAEEKLRNIMMGIDNQGFTVRRYLIKNFLVIRSLPLMAVMI